MTSFKKMEHDINNLFKNVYWVPSMYKALGIQHVPKKKREREDSLSHGTFMWGQQITASPIKCGQRPEQSERVSWVVLQGMSFQGGINSMWPRPETVAGFRDGKGVLGIEGRSKEVLVTYQKDVNIPNRPDHCTLTSS